MIDLSKSNEKTACVLRCHCHALVIGRNPTKAGTFYEFSGQVTKVAKGCDHIIGDTAEWAENGRFAPFEAKWDIVREKAKGEKTFAKQVLAKRPKPLRPGNRIKFVIPMGTIERKGTVERVIRIRPCTLETIVVKDDRGMEPLYITRRQVTKRLKSGK